MTAALLAYAVAAMVAENCSDVCQTRAGYLRHQKAGEQPCPASRDANAAYSRAYRRRSGLGPRTLTPRRLV